MNTTRKTNVLAALLCTAILASCVTNPKKSDGRQDLQRKLDEARAALGKYEKRYGKLSDSEPRHDYRKLKARLVGKNMKEVFGIIGSPSKVYSAGGGKESWDYYNIARDEITGRPVRDLEIWFTGGVVERVEASF